MRITRYSRPLALAAAVLASSAGAESRAKPVRRVPATSYAPAATAASGEASQADVARLQQQIDDQRALLLRILQMEREHLDLLVRMSGGAAAPVSVAPAVLPAQQPERAQPSPAVEPVSGSEQASAQPAVVRRAPRPAAAKPGATTGNVTGRVSVAGGSLENAVVYVESLRDKPVRGRRHEIKQLNKQFSPRFSVVPRGTTVSFPNQDSIFHNVFSLSSGNTFDLGTYRSGDKAGEVTLNTAGVVQVFCNLHSQMSASVLVTPSRYYAVVKKDGTFELENLPAGKHKLVAWMPNAEPVSREVEVGGDAPADLSFTLTAKANGTHTNKFGQPYGSYQE